MPKPWLHALRLSAIFVSLLSAGLHAADPDWLPVRRIIDDEINARLQQENVTPAPQAPDARLLRRLYLDLLGRTPTIGEAEKFLADPAPDKVHGLIDALLAHREMPLYWRRVIDRRLNGSTDQKSRRPGYDDFLAWLDDSLRTNRPWNETARSLLVPDQAADDDRRASYFLTSRLVGDKIEQLDNLATGVAGGLFGVQLQCAKCHDHPFVEGWKQDHYYGLAAFFTGLEAKNENGRFTLVQKTPGEVKFVTRGKEERNAAALFLDSKLLAEAAEKKPNRRELLAAHALQPESPYFKQSLVNQIWKQLFGRGLVEPVDQIHAANPATHPDLLQKLADDFAASEFNLRRLTAGILHSDAYLRDSRHSAASRPADELYAAAILKPLDGEQIAWSLVVATGSLDSLLAQVAKDPKRPPMQGEIDANLRIKWEREQEFDQIVGKFRFGSESFQANAGQALFLAFNPIVRKLLEPKGANLVTAMSAEQHAPVAVRQAVLSVLSRPATAEEEAELAALLDAAADRKQASADIVWALLTTAEFRFNH